MKWICVGCGQGVDYHGNPITEDERQAWCYDCAEEIERVAKRMGGARCRNCGNSGISPWTGKPCGCPAGKALARLQADNQVEQSTSVDVAHEQFRQQLQQSVTFPVYGSVPPHSDLTAKKPVAGVAFCVVCDRELPGYWRDDLDGCFYCHEHADMPTQQPAQANEPRAIIQAFAAAMERKLAANDGVKGGWRDGTGWNPQSGLRQRLQEEVGELLESLDDFTWRDGSEEAVLLEAADVALYAMMLADIVGALPPTDDRGR